MDQTCSAPQLSPDPQPTKAELEAILRSQETFYIDEYIARLIATLLWRAQRQAANPDAFLVPSANEVRVFPDGHVTYDGYLKGNLWNSIRRRVIERANHLCECCGTRAKDVHVRDYRPQVLRGDDLLPLVAICLTCRDYVRQDPMTGRDRASHDEEEFALSQIYGGRSLNCARRGAS